MPTHILVPTVVVSVTLVLAMCWAFGWTARARLDPELARRRYLQDHPELDILEVEVAEDGHSALVWTGADVGLVFAVGQHLATRTLERAIVSPLPTGIRLAFPDFGTPPVDVPVRRPIWAERLRSLRG